MYTSIEDFAGTYKHEAASTQKLLDALTDASLKQAVADDHRTLGRMAWHIITTYPEMGSNAELAFQGITDKSPLPTKAADIAKAYASVSKQLADQVSSKWNDAMLLQEKNFYGMMWKLGLMLDILIRHEVHHRGQMTVLMRQAGLKVPGVYGPAKEEWAGMGMNPPEV